VTNLSSVPMASKLLIDVMRTRPPIRSAASLPGMRIDPGNSPSATARSASSGNRWTSCSIRARRSSTAAGTVVAGGFSRSSASSLRAASVRVLVSSSFRRSSAISRPCSSSSRFCSAKSCRSSSSDGAAGAACSPDAVAGPKPRHAPRTRIDVWRRSLRAAAMAVLPFGHGRGILARIGPATPRISEPLSSLTDPDPRVFRTRCL